MRKKKNQSKKTTNAINMINKNIESITKNSEQTNEKIDQLININKSKLSNILTVIGIVISAITVFISILEFNRGSMNASPQYEIYLSSEYTKLKSYAETDIIAALDFDTASVTITAYLDSVKSGDTLEMSQKTETEWHKKVFFEEPGVYKVIATATTPNGNIIEDSVEIEVIPVN